MVAKMAELPHQPPVVNKLIRAAEKAVQVWKDNKDDIDEYDSSMKGLEAALSGFAVEVKQSKRHRPDPRQGGPI
jgi:hypothetical protein